MILNIPSTSLDLSYISNWELVSLVQSHSIDEERHL